MRGGRHARTRLDRLIEAFFEACVNNQALHHVLFHEAGFSEDDAFATMPVLLAQLVAEGVADGSFHVADPAIATDFLLAGIHAALISALHGHEHDHTAIVAHLTVCVSSRTEMRSISSHKHCRLISDESHGSRPLAESVDGERDSGVRVPDG